MSRASPATSKSSTSESKKRLGLVELPPAEIAKYFRKHPEVATALLRESYDKRFAPSTFIEERNGGLRVGWLTTQATCVREFSNLPDAATDYLLFSLGKGRWIPND